MCIRDRPGGECPGKRWWLAIQVCLESFEEFTIEEPPPGEEFVCDTPQGVDIGSTIRRLPSDLFGRHVPGRSEYAAGCGQLGGARVERCAAGDAEVDHGRVLWGPRADEDVLGFEVSMDDVLAMGLAKRVRDLLDEGDGPWPGQGAVLGDDLLQRPPGKEAHREERHAAGQLPKVCDLDDAGMLDGGDHLGLAQEACALLVGGEFGGAQQLEGHRPPQRDVFGLPDFAHTPHTQELYEAVATIHQVARPQGCSVYSGPHSFPGEGVVVEAGGHSSKGSGMHAAAHTQETRRR